MKIRNGFVSNSSSSSYIVRIKDTTWDEFCDLVSGDKGFYYREELVQKIDEEITRYETYINETKDDKDNILKSMIPIYKDQLAKLKKLKKKMPKDNDDQLVEIALEFHSIKWEVDEDCKEVELRDFTSMHNSFNEGMSPILREIVLTLMFDTNKKLKCERQDDGC